LVPTTDTFFAAMNFFTFSETMLTLGSTVRNHLEVESLVVVEVRGPIQGLNTNFTPQNEY
jgi:hypothetical protein